MSALNIKRGSSSHSAYDLRDPNAEVIESHTLAVLVLCAEEVQLVTCNGIVLQP